MAHVPQVTQKDGIATLIVQHGNDTRHWVGAVYARDQTGKVIHFESITRQALKPIVSSFKLPAGVTSVIAYEFCNIGGIFRSEPIRRTTWVQARPSTPAEERVKAAERA